MSSVKTIKSANDFAPNFDEYIQDCHWIGPEVLFGMMFENIKPNQTLLDIGIGTGLSSRLFKQAGLQIYGLDGSSEMIAICKSKGIAEDIKEVDLINNDQWFENVKFDQIISHGVFHLIGNLGQIFQKVFSVLNDNGYFGFTYESITDTIDDYKASLTTGVFERENKHSGIKAYRHSEEYIINLIKTIGFKLIKKGEFLAFVDPNTKAKTFFNILIVKKN